jgi:hypothetical protein
MMPVLTDCGLPGIRTIPFGVHMCNFYRTGEELCATLVPYFRAGLRRGERCIWITAEPLVAADAMRELRRTRFDADAAVAQGALKGSDVVALWLAEEQRAVAEGYSGLRITGNVTFLRDARDWQLFMEYEALLDEALPNSRIVTLCTYRLGDCGPSEMLDVMHRHNCALDRPDDGWQMLFDR